MVRNRLNPRRGCPLYVIPGLLIEGPSGVYSLDTTHENSALTRRQDSPDTGMIISVQAPLRSSQFGS